MYTVYISALIGIIIGFVINHFEKPEHKFALAPIFMGAACAIIGFVISLSFDPDKIRITKTEKLYVLKDNIKFCVFVNGSYYNFYIKDSTESIILKEAITFRSKIRFTNKQPYVETHYNINAGTEFNKKFAIREHVYENPSYVFYIPEGSLVSEYKIDAE